MTDLIHINHVCDIHKAAHWTLGHLKIILIESSANNQDRARTKWKKGTFKSEIQSVTKFTD